MIPHRMLSNEISGNGLRERVTACRKRLRVNRVTHHQSQALSGASEPPAEIAPLTDSLVTFPIGDRESLQSTDVTGVGIT